jgi:Na+/H+ antiporter NhaD/arsenite permease-like protein
VSSLQSTDIIRPVTTFIFAATYLFLALGKVPRLRLDRPGITLVGATAILVVGSLTIAQATAAVDVETIMLLFGMMVVTAFLRLSGFFAVSARWIAERFAGPYALLAVIIGLSGVLSAFLVNDVICVALTPLVLELTSRLRRPAVPYLIGLATAANIGSVATITGNPQNIIIGTLSRIPYAQFAAHLAPVAILGLLIDFMLIAFLYSRSLSASDVELVEAVAPVRPVRMHRKLLVRCVIVTVAMIALFFAGFPVALVAMAAASFLLLGRVQPHKIYREVDWPLLLMFAGLFIVVHAFEVHEVRMWRLERWEALRESPVVMVSGLSVVLSNLVSNVPAVLLFRPLIEIMPAKGTAWLSLAMSSTLAGNLTMLGSVANLIVVEYARRDGVEVTFGEFLKVGIPLTLLTTLVGVCWMLRFG